MTTENKPDPEALDRARAEDFYALIQRDLSVMTPGQLSVTKTALADFEAKKTDHSERDMNRKIARMNDAQLREFIRDCEDAGR